MVLHLDIKNLEEEITKKFVYCATPTQMMNKTDQIIKFVINQNCAPLHPFYSLPFEIYENGHFSREETLLYCMKLIKSCDELWTFGISEGVLIEVAFAEKRDIRIRHFTVDETTNQINTITYKEFIKNGKNLLLKEKSSSKFPNLLSKFR